MLLLLSADPDFTTCATCEGPNVTAPLVMPAPDSTLEDTTALNGDGLGAPGKLLLSPALDSTPIHCATLDSSGSETSEGRDW